MVLNYLINMPKKITDEKYAEDMKKYISETAMLKMQQKRGTSAVFHFENNSYKTENPQKLAMMKAIENKDLNALYDFVDSYKSEEDLYYLMEQFDKLDDNKQSGLFYAEYARIFYVLLKNKENFNPDEYQKCCQTILLLLEKSIKIRPTGSAAYLYLARFYAFEPNYTEFNGLNLFELAEKNFNIAIKNGSNLAFDELKKLRKRKRPDLSFDLINVEENLDALIENIKNSPNNKDFSLLLYGPVGSGKISVAYRLMKEIDMPYKDLSIIDFASRGAISFTEKDKSGETKTVQKTLRAAIEKYINNGKSGLIIRDVDQLFSVSLTANNTFEELRNVATVIEAVKNANVPIIMSIDDITLIPKNLQNAFLFRIGFNYMDTPQKEAAYNLFFNQNAPDVLKRIGGLVVDDFSRLKKKAEILNIMGDNQKIIELVEEEAKFKAGGNSYLKPDVEFNANLINSDTNLLELTEKLQKKADTAFTMIIYGPPGTGKSYYLRHLADKMGINTLEVTAADLFSKYQGQPAKNVCKLFKDAEERNAMIILDEIEEITKNRDDGESDSWRKDIANAFLTELESSKHPFACTTNFLEKIDKAILRRFVFKIKFDYLTKEQCSDAFKHFFKLSPPAELDKIGGLTNGDFATVKKKAIILDQMDDIQELFSMLKEESEKKAKVRVSQLVEIKDFDKKFINTDLDALDMFVKNIKRERKTDFSLLLYGPSGTGKSLYLRYLASELGYEVIERRASDILSKWYGESLKNLASAFDEAKNRKAFLVFDEIDSFLQDKQNSSLPWYDQLVNEFLVQLENHPYPVGGTTNYIDKIENASRRRFKIQANFDYLKPEQYDYIYRKTFGFEPLQDISKLKNITPALFALAYEKADLTDALEDKEKIYEIFIKEAEKSSKDNAIEKEDKTYQALNISMKALYNKPINEMYTEVLKGFVKIIVTKGHGSGFFITKDGFILTNRHVVDDEKYVTIELFSGRQIPGEVLRTNSLDVALIKVSEQNINVPMPLRLEELNIGSTVFSMGNPNTYDQVLAKGAITRYTTNERTVGSKRIETDSFSYGGVSGGPLMDEFGNVIGINVEGRLDPATGYKTKIGLALQIPIIEALESLNIKIKK